jgi:hypothetical protein
VIVAFAFSAILEFPADGNALVRMLAYNGRQDFAA